MKITKIIPIYMLMVMSMLTFFVATSFTYAYFDNLTTNQFETVSSW